MEGRIKMKITSLFLLLVTIMVLVPRSTKILSNSEDFTLNSANISYSTAQLTPHPPIVIDGNSEFATHASTEGWSGNGTTSNPYTIDGLNISEANNNNINRDWALIEIHNVDLHFQVANCLLTGGPNGIFFYNVSNGQLLNNTVTNNHNLGIYLEASYNNILANNAVTNNDGNGIELYNSYYNISYNNIFANNTVVNNTNSGIFLWSSLNNTLANNTVVNNRNNGVEFLWCYNNTFTNNTVANTSYDGISLYSSNNNILNNNIIANNSNNGIFLFGYLFCDNNVISDNLFANNREYGIFLSSWTQNNTVSWNSFINNNIEGTSQARDSNLGFSVSGLSNIFSYNYWDDWTGSDVNGDGIES
jgi:parallel beta-helix repeat protein